MFYLREVCVRVAVIHQCVQEFRRFPDGLLPFAQAEILAFFAEHIRYRLVRVVLAIKLGDPRGGGGVVLAELRFRLPFLVAALQELVPIVKVIQGLRWKHGLGTHRCSPGGVALWSPYCLYVTAYVYKT